MDAAPGVRGARPVCPSGLCRAFTCVCMLLTSLDAVSRVDPCRWTTADGGRCARPAAPPNRRRRSSADTDRTDRSGGLGAARTGDTARMVGDPAVDPRPSGNPRRAALARGCCRGAGVRGRRPAGGGLRGVHGRGSPLPARRSRRHCSGHPEVRGDPRGRPGAGLRRRPRRPPGPQACGRRASLHVPVSAVLQVTGSGPALRVEEGRLPRSLASWLRECWSAGAVIRLIDGSGRQVAGPAGVRRGGPCRGRRRRGSNGRAGAVRRGVAGRLTSVSPGRRRRTDATSRTRGSARTAGR